MISVNELRFGNLVIFNDEICKIVSAGKSNPHDAHVLNPTNYFPTGVKEENMHPIPITPDILERCGFVKDGFGAYNLSISPWESHFKILSFAGDYLYLREGDEIEHRGKDNLVTLWNKDLMKEFYLHELQTLYFALMRKELPYDAV